MQNAYPFCDKNFRHCSVSNSCRVYQCPVQFRDSYTCQLKHNIYYCFGHLHCIQSVWNEIKLCKILEENWTALTSYMFQSLPALRSFCLYCAVRRSVF
jgi:hypothetical protein